MNHDNLSSPPSDYDPDICTECESDPCVCPLCPGCGEHVEQSACEGCDICTTCVRDLGQHHHTCASRADPRCLDCEGSGRVWVKLPATGATVLLPCECRDVASDRLDTRPQDRAFRADGRRGDLLQLRAFELDQARRHPTPERIAVVEDLAAQAGRAFDWWRAWMMKAAP